MPSDVSKLATAPSCELGQRHTAATAAATATVAFRCGSLRADTYTILIAYLIPLCKNCTYRQLGNRDVLAMVVPSHQVFKHLPSKLNTQHTRLATALPGGRGGPPALPGGPGGPAALPEKIGRGGDTAARHFARSQPRTPFACLVIEIPRFFESYFRNTGKDPQVGNFGSPPGHPPSTPDTCYTNRIWGCEVLQHCFNTTFGQVFTQCCNTTFGQLFTQNLPVIEVLLC